MYHPNVKGKKMNLLAVPRTLHKIPKFSQIKEQPKGKQQMKIK